MSSLANSAMVQPNLTPILDMVFQLITFFMMVVNFKTASLDQSLKLPVIGSARPASTEGQEDLLVLNIDATGQLRMYGQTLSMESFIASESQASALTARRLNPNYQRGEELPTRVVIRADGAIPFHLLNRVITTCQVNGFRRFSFKAHNQRDVDAISK